MTGLVMTPVSTLTDWQEALKIRYEVFVDGQNVPEIEEIDQTDLISFHVLARLDGRPCGTGRLYFEADGPLPDPPTDAELAAAHIPREQAQIRVPIVRNPGESERARIGRMAVLDAFQGQKVGKGVLNALEATAWRKGVKRILLASQDHAIGFYKRLGYTVISDTFLDANIEHVWMEKRRN